MEAGVSIPAQFNAARFFIDRHIEEGHGDRVALMADGTSVTYRDLERPVNRVGNALWGLGVGRGGRVLLALLDGPEFVASFFGAIKIGAVPVPVNTVMGAADRRYFLEDSRAPVAIVSEALLPEVGKALPGAAHLRKTVVVGEPPADQLRYAASVDLGRGPR